jgi:hypothetical protein
MSKNPRILKMVTKILTTEYIIYMVLISSNMTHVLKVFLCPKTCTFFPDSGSHPKSELLERLKLGGSRFKAGLGK